MAEKNPSPNENDSEADMHHFSSKVPLPLMLSDPAILRSVSYRRRTNVPKSSIHWGQRKLLLSELQFLTLYASPRHTVPTADALKNVHQDPCCLVVYAGSAPGTHLLTMPKIFPQFFNNFHFELHDPRKFDQNLYEWEKEGATLNTEKETFSRGGITIVNGYFDDATAIDVFRRRLHKRKGLQLFFQSLYQGKDASTSSFLNSDHCALKTLFYAAAEDTPLLFISDIRTGSLTSTVAEEDFDLHYKNEEFEKEVKQNMADQLRWHQIMQPKHSMLKFRLPYVDDDDAKGIKAAENETTQYLSGDIVLPIWTRPTSSECRLVTSSLAKDGGSTSDTFPPVQLSKYGNNEYQNQLYYFNSVVRENFHFNHFYNLDAANRQENVAKKPRGERTRNLDLDHRYDASMELEVLASAIVVEKLAKSGHVIPENLQGESKFHWIMRDGLQIVLGDSPRHTIYNEALILSQQITKALRRTFDNAIRAREEIILEKARACSWTECALRLIKSQRENREQPRWWKNFSEE